MLNLLSFKTLTVLVICFARSRCEDTTEPQEGWEKYITKDHPPNEDGQRFLQLKGHYSKLKPLRGFVIAVKEEFEPPFGNNFNSINISFEFWSHGSQLDVNASCGPQSNPLSESFNISQSVENWQTVVASFLISSNDSKSNKSSKDTSPSGSIPDDKSSATETTSEDSSEKQKNKSSTTDPLSDSTLDDELSATETPSEDSSEKQKNKSSTTDPLSDSTLDDELSATETPSEEKESSTAKTNQNSFHESKKLKRSPESDKTKDNEAFLYYNPRIIIEPPQIQAEEELDFYIALRNIKITYKSNKIDPSTSITQSEDLYTLECNSYNCEKFDIGKANWSKPNLPISAGDSYFMAKNSGSEFRVELENNSVVDFSYWVTGNSSMGVKINGEQKITLTASYNISDASERTLYAWYKARIDPSYFNFQQNSVNLSFVAFWEGANEKVALKIENTTVSDSKANIALPPLLESWNKTGHWRDNFTCLITQPETVSYDDSEKNVQLNMPSTGEGRFYLRSRWFKYHKLHQVRYSLQVQNGRNCTQDLTVITVIEDQNKVVAMSKDEFCKDGDLIIDGMIEKNFTLNAKTSSEALAVMLEIDWKSEEVGGKIVISDFDVSDACRDGRKECSDHGNCINEAANKAKCQCDSGYYGPSCELIDWCKKSISDVNVTGDQYCENQNGTCRPDNFSSKELICECSNQQIWRKRSNQENFMCDNLEPCDGKNEFCSIGEECIDKKNGTNCECKEGYTRDSKSHCVPTKFYKKGRVCEVFNNRLVCHCPLGLVSDGIESCATPGCNYQLKKTHQCSQTCRQNSSGEIECSCFDGYEFDADDKVCKATSKLHKCEPNCKEYEICVLESDETSKCECLLGYMRTVESDCKDVCTLAKNANETAIKMVKQICGNSTSCTMEKDQIKCDCQLPYKVHKDGFCRMDDVCSEDQRGFNECRDNSTICVPTSTSPYYTCRCPIGTKPGPNGQCVDLNENNPGLYKNAVCRISLDPEKKEPECMCQVGLRQTKPDGECYLIEKSVRAEMVLRLGGEILSKEIQSQRDMIMTNLLDSKNENWCRKTASWDFSGCLRYLEKVANSVFKDQEQVLEDMVIRENIAKNLREALNASYSKAFGDVQVIRYEKVDSNTRLGGDYKVVVATEKIMENGSFVEDIKKMCLQKFGDSETTKNYCYVPENIVLRSESVVEQDFKPCNEASDSYCPANTICLQDFNSSKFSCECMKGFEAEHRISLDSEDPLSPFAKEFCRDIDECAESPCPKDRICTNLPGSHECNCPEKQVLHNGECVDACEALECENGKCEFKQKAVCSCEDGFKGESCDIPDPDAVKWRSGFLTITVVLGLLLVLVSVASAILIKKAKRGANESSHHPMEDYTPGRRPIGYMPKRFQDNRGFSD